MENKSRENFFSILVINFWNIWISVDHFVVKMYILTWNKEEFHILYVATSPVAQPESF